MATTQKTKLTIWFAALALVMACVPSLTTESVPTVDPGAIDTLIVQTANAASSQTAAVLPVLPSTTMTWTPVPTRNTETPTPTATSTVIFVFFSPTPVIIPTFTASGSASDTYACQVISVSPTDGTSFSPREDFDAIWVVKNIGKKKWDRSTVNYAFASGDKFHTISSYDLSESLGSGNILELGVNMQAPKDPGIYTTTWTLRAGKKSFCPLNLTIRVKEAQQPEGTQESPEETEQPQD
ncbi:MAG TPA: NBR1-Ig-like domain-containing protein [Anaerolineales bacterium]|nr:NBR1-Ig-like domain-containing protein [Anaerolineales bacterium]